MRIVRSLALLFVVAVNLLALSSLTSAQQVIDWVAAGDQPSVVAVNSATNQIFVTNYASNTVTVINGANDTIAATITVGSVPDAIAINSVTNKIYVANYGSNTISVIDGSTLRVTATPQVGGAPVAIAADTATNTIYVVNYQSNNVSVINGSTDTVAATVQVGYSPNAIAINSATNTVYIANLNNTVAVMNGSAPYTVSTVDMGARPYSLAVDSATDETYVVTGLTLSVISPNLSVSTVTLPQWCSMLAVNATTDQIYVLGSTLYVVNGSTLTVSPPITTDPAPSALLADAATNKIYLTNSSSNSLIAVDGATLSVSAVDVGVAPTGIDVNQTTNRIYVSNFGANTVSVLSGVPYPLQLIPITPCRLIDTRQTGGMIQGGTSRSFVLPQLGDCGLPQDGSAKAYSLNVTVVPPPGGTLGYLTIWPTGENQPLVSTMNSPDGRTKANAAIIPFGYQGAVSVYVSDPTNVILDINGYFAPPTQSSLQFYPLPPCRVVDTRNSDGTFGGPALQANQVRSFPMLQSSCLPTGLNIAAYSLNFTVVPNPAGQPLNYLTVWPMGEQQPYVSTLNNPTATVVANAAIVPAGTNGEISVYAYNSTDLLVDINGYFAAPATGGISFYPLDPCRALDTRQDGGPFTGMRIVNIEGSVCAPPTTAQGYALNATVVPSGSMPFLTLWPDGIGQPNVSTLNADDGFVTSNMAIIPTNDGSIDAYDAGLTQLILDISGYFAP